MLGPIDGRFTHRLLVIIGRKTFSSAILNALAFERDHNGLWAAAFCHELPSVVG